jgi:hypothetical protein
MRQRVKNIAVFFDTLMAIGYAKRKKKNRWARFYALVASSSLLRYW